MCKLRELILDNAKITRVSSAPYTVLNLNAKANPPQLSVSTQKFTRVSLLNGTCNYRKENTYLTWKSKRTSNSRTIQSIVTVKIITEQLTCNNLRTAEENNIFVLLFLRFLCLLNIPAPCWRDVS